MQMLSSDQQVPKEWRNARRIQISHAHAASPDTEHVMSSAHINRDQYMILVALAFSNSLQDYSINFHWCPWRKQAFRAQSKGLSDVWLLYSWRKGDCLTLMLQKELIYTHWWIWLFSVLCVLRPGDLFSVTVFRVGWDTISRMIHLILFWTVQCLWGLYLAVRWT